MQYLRHLELLTTICGGIGLKVFWVLCKTKKTPKREVPKSEGKKHAEVFTKLFFHKAQSLGNTERAAGPDSSLGAPMNELPSRRTMHV